MLSLYGIIFQINVGFGAVIMACVTILFIEETTTGLREFRGGHQQFGGAHQRSGGVQRRTAAGEGPGVLRLQPGLLDMWRGRAPLAVMFERSGWLRPRSGGAGCFLVLLKFWSRARAFL